MAIQVEHDKRKHEILEKALGLFIEEGYEDVTFQKIADRCGVTRTTLYIYFKNKREIFLWSIKQLMGGIEQRLLCTIRDTNLSAEDCLRRIFFDIITECESHIQLFRVLLTYVIQLQKKGISVDERVKRRVVRLRHFMTAIIIRGQQNGEFRPLPIKELDTLLYTLLESAIFHLVVLERTNLDDIRDVADFTIDHICVCKKQGHE